jgi:LCP family protein required for cell wall assembly
VAWSEPRRKWLIRATLVVLVGGLAFAGWQAARGWLAWRGIERVEFDLASVRDALPTQPTLEEPIGEAVAPQGPDLAARYDAFLAIGSDQKLPEEPSDQEIAYADAVLLWLADNETGSRYLISLPRDLYVVDPCTGRQTKLNSTLGGCGATATGSELVSLAVEGYTGIPIDHFALFEFGAFIDVIDRLGGVDVCVPHALRERTEDLLPAGCSVIDGATALAWIRSRETQELVDGEWRFVEGVGDALRSERQQQLMLALLAKLNRMRTPNGLVDVVNEIGDGLVLDERLSMAGAIGLAWELRNVSASAIKRPTIPTEASATPDGSFALVPTMPFLEVLANA